MFIQLRQLLHQDFADLYTCKTNEPVKLKYLLHPCEYTAIFCLHICLFWQQQTPLNTGLEKTGKIQHHLLHMQMQ